MADTKGEIRIDPRAVLDSTAFFSVSIVANGQELVPYHTEWDAEGKIQRNFFVSIPGECRAHCSCGSQCLTGETFLVRCEARNNNNDTRYGGRVFINCFDENAAVMVPQCSAHT